MRDKLSKPQNSEISYLLTYSSFMDYKFHNQIHVIRIYGLKTLNSFLSELLAELDDLDILAFSELNKLFSFGWILYTQR